MLFSWIYQIFIKICYIMDSAKQHDLVTHKIDEIV